MGLLNKLWADRNRIALDIATLGLVLFWAWDAFWLMLIYAPSTDPDGNTVYKYADKNKVRYANFCNGYDKKNGYCMWYYPFLFAATLCALAARRVANLKPRKHRWLPAGDLDFTLLCYVAFGIPILLFWVFYMKKKWPSRSKYDDTPEGQRDYVVSVMKNFANRTGFAAIWAMVFFMVPASKHQPILAVLDWHPFHAMTIHMWLGTLAFWLVIAHFFFYIMYFGLRGEYKGWPAWRFFFPKAECFALPLNKPDDYTMDPNCGKMAFGAFFGLLSTVFFIFLYCTSIKYVRRYRYNLFYVSHIICAPAVIAFAVMHWVSIHFYFWPGMLYYFSSQAPFLVQHWRHTINRYGLKITRVVDIPCRDEVKDKGTDDAIPEQRSLIRRIFAVSSADWLDEQINLRGPTAKIVQTCVSFDFEVSERGMQEFRPGVYGNIWVPDYGVKSHPFTIMHVPGKKNQLRIVFRVFGKFTDLLARSLIRLVEPTFHQEVLPIPKIMLDGWHGSDQLVAHALNHDKVVLIAAGIGITAFMSLFCELTELLGFKGDGLSIKQSDIKNLPVTKEVTLNFLCRDENLIRFITDEYFGPLLTRASFHSPKVTDSSDSHIIEGENGSTRIRIVIHRTGPLQSKDVRESVLWKSFVDKDPEGPSEIDQSHLGVYGTAWLPSRFTFGRNETSLGSLPAIAMFMCIFWFSYWFTFKVTAWVRANPWGIDGALEFIFYFWSMVPTPLVAFAFAYAGHILYDWYDNVKASKENDVKRDEIEGDWNYKFHQVESYLASTKTPQSIASLTALASSKEEADVYVWAADERKILIDENIKSSIDHDRLKKLNSLNIDWGAKDPEKASVVDSIEIPEQSSTPLPSSQFLSLVSKPGRPSGEDLLFDEDSVNIPQSSTGVFLCGPEAMINSVKKAAGIRCTCAAERMQNLIKGNEFVIYEEKFEW